MYIWVMPIPEKYIASFEQGAYYHVICKSLDKQNLFLSDENKRFFLQRYYGYTRSYLKTYCYSLLDNHAHFLVQIRSEGEIIQELAKLQVQRAKLTIIQQRFLDQQSEMTVDPLLERQFNSFFVSYTRSFNNMYKRRGHLFDSPFKRIRINDDTHLTQVVVYIHANSMRHRISEDFQRYFWSSFNSLLSDKPTS
jgi:putative transposase